LSVHLPKPLGEDMVNPMNNKLLNKNKKVFGTKLFKTLDLGDSLIL